MGQGLQPDHIFTEYVPKLSLLQFKGGSLRSSYAEGLFRIPASNFSIAKIHIHQKPKIKAPKILVSSFPVHLIHIPVCSWPADNMRLTLLSKRTSRGRSQGTGDDTLANGQIHLTLFISRELPEPLREPRLLHFHTPPLHHPLLPPLSTHQRCPIPLTPSVGHPHWGHLGTWCFNFLTYARLVEFLHRSLPTRSCSCLLNG